MGPAININVGALAKPAVVLIEKVSDAIGVVFEPTRIRRKAKAESDAAITRALGQLELSNIERRALQRLVAEESMRQENIESITFQATESLQSDAKPQELDDDWLAHFFDRCRLVSDTQMQGVWARLLAGQANSPGTFSKRTIDLVSTLEKSDADMFTKLCGFVCDVGVNQAVPLVYAPGDNIYHSHGLSFESLIHLESLGLIRFEPSGGYSVDELDEWSELRYFDHVFTVKGLAGKSNREIHVGTVLLTRPGMELSAIAGARPVDGFPEYVAFTLALRGCRLASKWPQRYL